MPVIRKMKDVTPLLWLQVQELWLQERHFRLIRAIPLTNMDLYNKLTV